MIGLYNIERAEYNNGKVCVTGWIFSSRRHSANEIRQLELSIALENGKTITCRLGLHERQDVMAAYGLKYDNVGINFQEKIGEFHNAKLYISYFINGKKRQAWIASFRKMEGAVSDSSGSCRMWFPDFQAHYSIKNFHLLRKKFYHGCVSDGKIVDVVLPVFNGYEYLDKLFAAMEQTEWNMRIIIINDCSTDERISPYFKLFCQNHDNVVYIENKKNLGFVKSVNEGLKLAKHDVVLLNTDIELPPYWLERLMQPIFADESIASATPYTNCGTLCSFPEIGVDNEIFDECSVVYVDSVFQEMYPSYTRLPTGVGFCMGMSLRALKQVGLLDEENFSKGYGEENDWCQRAVKAGFQNVQVENLFVYHKHGGSFLPKEKDVLSKENLETLVQKHPGYKQDVTQYFQDDVNKVYRKYALFQCLMQRNTYTIVCFHHALGGGADAYMKKKKAELLRDTSVKFIEFRYHAYQNLYLLEITYKDYCMKLYSDYFADIFSELKLTSISEIYVNELVTYPEVFTVLENILDLKKYSGARLVMFLHDYFCICPTINLLSGIGEYCGMNCADQNCLKYNKYLQNVNCTDIQKWRKQWAHFLKQCDSVIAFSDDMKQKLESIYSNLAGIQVIPHRIDRMMPINKRYKSTDTVNIAVLGVLNTLKGYRIIKEMLSIINRKKLLVNIVVIGTCEEKINGKHCIVTGTYTREQLPSLMYLYDIDIVFIASICPETFSYTTAEAMEMGVPVAVFDLGAPAERVKKYKKGMIIKKMEAGAALKQILQYTDLIQVKRSLNGRKVLFLIDYPSFSSRYRVEHLRENLAVRGIWSDVAVLRNLHLSKIGQYDVIFLYRCANVKKIYRIAKKARQYGVSLFYDIDDYIFEWEQIRGLDFMQYEEYRDFEKYSGNIRKCMELCDVLTTSTSQLSAAMRRCFSDKKVIVYRNTASMEMQLLSEITQDYERKESEKVVLGYFSGTKTHNADWKLIENVVIHVMEHNENVHLLLVGLLEISEELMVFHKRIKTVPFVKWQKLPGLIRSVDINLMPLENGFFQWCKSENKWMEAGLVGVATIASSNPELADVLEDGKNVILCKDVMEWERAVLKLISDKELRIKIGLCAKREVYQTHLVTCDENFDQVVECMLLSKNCKAEIR